jgi:hypothetical protein
MRRMLGLALALCLALTPVAPAYAQFATVGPGGVVDYSTASTTCVNTATACTLYTYTIPQGLVATGTIAPATATTTMPNVSTSPPLHFVARGVLSTQSTPGTINVGVNFGGSTATLALVNGVSPTASLALTPVTLEVWVSPVKTATDTAANTVVVNARLAYQVGTAIGTASEVTFNANVVGTTSVRSAQALSVLWRWTTASNTNAITLYQRTLGIGN